MGQAVKTKEQASLEKLGTCCKVQEYLWAKDLSYKPAISGVRSSRLVRSLPKIALAALAIQLWPNKTVITPWARCYLKLKYRWQKHRRIALELRPHQTGLNMPMMLSQWWSTVMPTPTLPQASGRTMRKLKSILTVLLWNHQFQDWIQTILAKNNQRSLMQRRMSNQHQVLPHLFQQYEPLFLLSWKLSRYRYPPSRNTYWTASSATSPRVACKVNLRIKVARIAKNSSDGH